MPWSFFVTFLAVIVILCAGGIVPFGQHSLLDSSTGNSVLNLFFQEDGTVIPQAEAFCADSVGQDEISGTITLAEDARLLLILPLAGEWEISCDGEEADTTALAKNLLLVNTGQGTHEMRFIVPQ